MNPREKKLALAVGVIVGVILNYLLLEFFFQHQGQLRADLMRKKSELVIRREFLNEKELWEKRSAWAQANQPKLTNPAGAGVALLDVVKEIAKKDNVQPDSPTIGSPEKRAYFTSVSVNFETKSNWESLCKFLGDVQQPEQFMVFENAQIQVDSSDKTQMHGKFRVAKWFALK